MTKSRKTEPEFMLEAHDDQLGKVAHVVVLVHGTFARSAAWTLAGAGLSQKLKCDLAPAALYRFVWSGANSHRARLDAGAALKRKLVELRQRHPGAHLSVIGHSHGGNVIMYAARDRLSVMDTAVCLATPFIHALKTRDEVTWLWRYNMYVLHLLGVVILSYLATRAWGSSYYFGGALLGVLGVVAGVAISLRAYSRLRRSPAVDAAALSLPTVDKDKVMAIRPVGDEAEAGLDSFYLASLILRKIWSVLDWLAKRAWSVFAYGVAALLILTWGLRALGQIRSDIWEGPASLLADANATLFTFFIVGLGLAGLLVAFFASLMIIAQRSFGWDAPRLAFTTQTSVEESPLG